METLESKGQLANPVLPGKCMRICNACRFAKVGNTTTGDGSARMSRHLHCDETSGQSEMTSDALDGSNSSWRLSLLRSVMGDTICETGSYFVTVVTCHSKYSNSVITSVKMQI